MRLAKTIEVRRASWTSQEVNRACSYNSISLQGVLIKRKCLKRKSFGQFSVIFCVSAVKIPGSLCVISAL